MVTALPLVAATVAVRPSTAGLLVACTSGVQVLAGPLLGAGLDRSPRRRTRLAAAPIAFAAPLATVLALLGHAPVAVLAGLCLAAGTAGPLLLGGMSAALLDASDRPLRPTLRADATAYNLAAIAGPLLAAGLVAAAGTGGVAAALVALALVSATITLRLPVTPAAGSRPSAGPLAAAAPLWRSRPLRASTVASTLGFVTVGGLPLVLVARAEQLAAPSLAGVALAVAAAAALAAALVPVDAPTAGRRIGVALAAEAAGLGLLAVAPSAPVLLVGMVVLGAGSGALLPAILAVRAAHSRSSERSAVFGTAASLKIAAGALGAALTGVALDTARAPTVILALAVVQLAAIALHRAIDRERPPRDLENAGSSSRSTLSSSRAAGS